MCKKNCLKQDLLLLGKFKMPKNTKRFEKEMQHEIKDAPDSGGRDKGCHWTCNGLDGTK